MAIYFIQDTKTKSVKIGFTTNILKRLCTLQQNNAHPLVVLALFDGGKEDERALHQSISTHRMRGEWYAKAAAAEIDRVRLPKLEIPKRAPPKPSVRKGGRPKRARPDAGLLVVIALAKTISNLAALLGVSVGAVSQWAMVPSRHVATLANTYKISPHAIRPDLYDENGDRIAGT
jgi:hypothetical protein